jgi:hypothetical protein
MRGRDRRFLCTWLGLAVLASGLMGFGAWRYYALRTGGAGGSLWYRPSPRWAEYEALSGRRNVLEARAEAGDPEVGWDQVEAATQAQRDMWNDLIQEDNRRWQTASTFEVLLDLVTGLGGAGLLLFTLALWAQHLRLSGGRDPTAQRVRRTAT